jgi:hypothetical protein
MVRLHLALVCALGVLLLMPQGASAGGWWSFIDVGSSHVAPGQRVELAEAVAFSSVADAEAAQQADRFYVYLLRDFDYSVVERAMREASPGDWWSLGGAEAIQVGQVAVTVSDANLARATAAFTMPELPPATYHLMLCDKACAEPLADVVPAALPDGPSETEREGFEPSRQFDPPTRFPVVHLQPLGHLSRAAHKTSFGCPPPTLPLAWPAWACLPRPMSPSSAQASAGSAWPSG